MGNISLESCIPEYCRSRVLILGCGNILFGDDGFGPAVIKYLQNHYNLPNYVSVLDVGTGIRDVLCTIALSPIRPQRIIAIDTMITGKQPGEVLVMPVEDFPLSKGGSFSLHQLPTSSLLMDLKNQCQLDILLIVVEPQPIPEMVAPGLSLTLQKAVSLVCDYIVRNLCGVEQIESPRRSKWK